MTVSSRRQVVTTALLPLLTASEQPRIVNVTSITGSLALTAEGTDFGGTPETRMAYAPSKVAQSMLTLHTPGRMPRHRSCAISR